jgi:hypothetical protein
MKQRHANGNRYAERVVDSRDDRGEAERVTIWIDRREGGVWCVGRAVNIALRETDEPRPEDTIFEGYEMADALLAANEALEADVEASADVDDGRNDGVRPFTESELKRKLERWFFDAR